MSRPSLFFPLLFFFYSFFLLPVSISPRHLRLQWGDMGFRLRWIPVAYVELGNEALTLCKNGDAFSGVSRY